MVAFAGVKGMTLSSPGAEPRPHSYDRPPELPLPAKGVKEKATELTLSQYCGVSTLRPGQELITSTTDLGTIFRCGRTECEVGCRATEQHPSLGPTHTVHAPHRLPATVVQQAPKQAARGAHPQPCCAEQAGGSERSHSPPRGLRAVLLGSMRRVPFREGILSTRHAGTTPHSPALPWRSRLRHSQAMHADHHGASAAYQLGNAMTQQAPPQSGRACRPF